MMSAQELRKCIAIAFPGGREEFASHFRIIDLCRSAHIRFAVRLPDPLNCVPNTSRSCQSTAPSWGFHGSAANFGRFFGSLGGVTVAGTRAGRLADTEEKYRAIVSSTCQ